MKNRLIKITLLVSCIIAFVACSSDGELRDLNVSAVKTLYTPDNGKAIELKGVATAAVTFEWEPARAEDGGMVLYEIAFDKTDGDFSNPVYRAASYTNGSVNKAIISHKDMNKIAGQMGIEADKTGTFKWTVFSSKGINPKKAEQERTITITRLALSEIPDKLYITGDATENGDDLSKALLVKKVADGEFEIYTKLTAGKTFKFVNANSGTPKEFSVSGEKIVEGGSCSVSKTGIYKYYLDFSIGAFSMKEVTKVNLFLCWSQREIELPYKGEGIWEITGHAISGLPTGGDNDDDRYKFRMESSAGATEWRAPNNDSKPSGNASYYYMVERDDVKQWTDNQIWKSPSTTGWNGKSYDVTFSLNANEPYTHNLVIK